MLSKKSRRSSRGRGGRQVTLAKRAATSAARQKSQRAIAPSNQELLQGVIAPPPNPPNPPSQPAIIAPPPRTVADSDKTWMRGQGVSRHLSEELESSTQQLMNDIQEARKQAESDRQVLRKELESVRKDRNTNGFKLEMVSKDRDAKGRALELAVRELEATKQLLKESYAQRVFSEAQSVKNLVELNKKSIGIVNEKWESELKAVRKDRDASELVTVQKSLELKKIVHFYEDSRNVTNKKLAEARDDLKKKEDELTRLMAQGDTVFKVDPDKLEEIKQELDMSKERNLRVTDILSKTMEELLAERSIRRGLEKRLEEVEATWASQKAHRIRKLQAELAAASGEHVSPPVASAVEMKCVESDTAIKQEMVDL